MDAEYAPTIIRTGLPTLFAVIGGEGYVVNLAQEKGATCTCKDHQFRKRDCKHILAVRRLIAVSANTN